MRLSEIVPSELTDDQLDRLLFEGLEYGGESAGLIMVLGSRKACDYRIPLAAELYRAGRAPRVLLCGGKVQETSEGTLPEFEAMRRRAQALGIDREHILTEERSMTTAENLIFGGGVIRDRLPGCRDIILVTAPYHMRRAVLMAKKLLPGYMVYPCPAVLGATRRENWRSSVKARRRVLDESEKFGYYIKMGYIDDTDI